MPRRRNGNDGNQGRPRHLAPVVTTKDKPAEATSGPASSRPELPGETLQANSLNLTPQASAKDIVWIAPRSSRELATRSPSVLASIRYAWSGIGYLFRSQRNFRIQLVIAVSAMALAAVLQLSALHWMILLTMSTMMLGLEALNTAIEACVDWLCQRRWHPRAKIIKDVSAAACLIAAAFSIGVGLLLFVPPILMRTGLI